MHIFERSYDPLTGLWTTIGTQDDKLVVKTEGDVSAAMDHATELRNDDEYSRVGIKKNWWHAFHIPTIVALKMISEDGFDPYKQPTEETFKFLRRNREKYGACLTTRGAF